MAKRKNKIKTEMVLKRNLIIIVLMVIAMIGMTYAWFTSESSVNVNKVQSGKLKVELVDADGNSLEGSTLSFVKNGEGEILWEPGATYNLQEIYIKNKGNLDVAYYIEISGATGDTELMDVIDWSFNEVAVDEKYTLKAGMTTEAIVLSGHMKEDAGNEYQDLSIEGIAITVHATQLDSEADSTDNTYDKNAYNDMIATRVSSVSELKSAISNGEKVVLEDDVTLNETLTISGNNDAYINLNGYTISTDGFSTTYAVYVTSGSSLEITNGTIDTDLDYALLSYGDMTVENMDVTGGKYGIYSYFDTSSLVVKDSEIKANNFGIYTKFTKNVEIVDTKTSAITLSNYDSSKVADLNAKAIITGTTIETNNTGLSIEEVVVDIKDTKIVSENANGILSYNNIQPINIDNVIVEAKGFALTQNGGENPITIKVTNSKLKSVVNPAIYIANTETAYISGKPQTLIVDKCEIEGLSGIELKYTNATITNSKLMANTSDVAFRTDVTWSGGAVTKGRALAMTSGNETSKAYGEITLSNNTYVGDIYNHLDGANIVEE